MKRLTACLELEISDLSFSHVGEHVLIQGGLFVVVNSKVCPRKDLYKTTKVLKNMSG